MTATAEATPAKVTTATPGASITGRRAWLVYSLAMAGLALLLMAVQSNDYWLNILVMSYLFAGLAVAWNIIGGFGGQLSLGHGVYFAIGAYSVGILYTRHGWSPWLCLAVAVPLALIVAAITSWPTFRLRGPFFAMATLALNQVMLVLATFFDSLTGGPRGITLPFEPGWANITFLERWKYGLVMLVFVAVAVAVSTHISRSRLGYALRAVREDDSSAEAVGINVFAVKMRGMLISAAITAVGGGLFATYISYIDPHSVLSLADISVRLVLIALLGGMGSVAGPVIGALILIPAVTQLQASLAGTRPGLSLFAVGLLLVLIPLAFRRGVVGTVTDLVRMGRRAR